MSSAFTGQAIATGFERQYGVLKRLGATPLPRSVLLLAKTLGVLVVAGAAAVAHRLRRPRARLGAARRPRSACCCSSPSAPRPSAASACCSAARCRGLTTLAAANLVWLVLLVLGGVVFPLDEFGAGRAVLSLLPTAALSHGLRAVLQDGALAPLPTSLALAVWAVVALAAATRCFRWE